MGKSSTPAAPNYQAAAQATAAGNLQNAQYATQANRPNMTTPWGTSTWTQTPQYDMNAYNAATQKYQSGQMQPSSPTQYTSDGVPITGYGQSTGSNGTAPQLSDYSNGSSWSNNVSLSPSQQALFDQQNRLQQGLFGAQNNALGYVNQNMSQPFSGQPLDPNSVPLGTVFDPNSVKLGSVLDPNSLPAMGSVYDPTQATNNATQLIMDRLNPQLDRQQASMQSQLAQQGVSQGSDAWNNAVESFNRSRNDAQNQAALTGINLGMGQQAQTYGQQMGNRNNALQTQAQQFGQTDQNAGLFAQLQNQAFNQTNANAGLFGQLQNQGFNQTGYAYNLPMNTLNGLMSGNQVSAPQFQSFASQGYTPGADYTGAANSQYQAALGNSNAQNAAANNTMGGLFSLGSGALLSPAGTFAGLGAASALPATASWAAPFLTAGAGMMSDRRTKMDIVRVGRADNGLNIYSYRYKWGGPTMLGYMADEVEQIAPHAVGEFGGFKTVDYARV